MATNRSATIYITNNMNGNARVFLFHSNSSNGTQSGNWLAAPGQRVGPLSVLFQTGPGSFSTLDYWWVLVHVQDGPNAGFYCNSRALTPLIGGKECQLQSKDAGNEITLSVSPTQFNIALPSGGCSDDMTKVAPYSKITHVFVVMLENRSFENMFAWSWIPGIWVPQEWNYYQGQAYASDPNQGAPLRMSTDPGHEFLDVLQQLTGQVVYPSGGPYPAIKNNGFVANYATSTTEYPNKPPTSDHWGDVMLGFKTQQQLPVLYQLATQFAVCDQWFSSMPGPTWPNRFFVHGASSSGLDDSPTNTMIQIWETISGFEFPNGSIYDRMKTAGIPFWFYNDNDGWGKSAYSDDPQDGKVLGAVPQVAAIAGVSKVSQFSSLKNLQRDLQGPYPYPYTFIEPHYGNVNGDYRGGSSQHPLDDVYGGEHLLAAVYSAIRNSPYWDTSLLIITYDEHGGFYDGFDPSTYPCIPPGDNPTYGYNKHGFTFDRYGVRVPAVIVSPLIPKGTVDHTVYDHSSVPKTLEQLFGLQPLTKRDAAANSVVPLLSLTTPRTDCPTNLLPPAPLMKAARPPMTAEERAQWHAQPLPESGNLVGALWVLAKTDYELSAGTPEDVATIQSKVKAIQTRGQAEAYAQSVMEKVALARRQRELAASQEFAAITESRARETETPPPVG